MESTFGRKLITSSFLKSVKNESGQFKNKQSKLIWITSDPEIIDTLLVHFPFKDDHNCTLIHLSRTTFSSSVPRVYAPRMFALTSLHSPSKADVNNIEVLFNKSAYQPRPFMRLYFFFNANVFLIKIPVPTPGRVTRQETRIYSKRGAYKALNFYTSHFVKTKGVSPRETSSRFPLVFLLAQPANDICRDRSKKSRDAGS